MMRTTTTDHNNASNRDNGSGNSGNSCVYFLKNPAEGKYILVIYRPSGGMFGMFSGGVGMRHTVVGVDELDMTTSNDGTPTRFRGYRNGALVVEFPAAYSYLLLERGLVEMITPAEAARRQKEEDEEISRILGDPQHPAEDAPENDRSLRYL